MQRNHRLKRHGFGFACFILATLAGQLASAPNSDHRWDFVRSWSDKRSLENTPAEQLGKLFKMQTLAAEQRPNEETLFFDQL